MKKIGDKIKEIEQYLNEFKEIIPKDFESYIGNLKDKAACERYFEKIVEAAVDLSFQIIKERKLEIPDDDKKSFDILTKYGIITSKITVKLKEAKGMRNLLAHEYGKVDDNIVFESLNDGLFTDMEEFLRQVKKSLKLDF